MAKSVREQIADLISDMEKRARRARADLRKQYKAVPGTLDEAAARVRAAAADFVQQIEAYARDLGIDLHALTRRGAAKRKAAKRGTAKRAAKKSAKRAPRKAAKKTARKKTAKKKSARR